MEAKKVCNRLCASWTHRKVSDVLQSGMKIGVRGTKAVTPRPKPESLEAGALSM